MTQDCLKSHIIYFNAIIKTCHVWIQIQNRKWTSCFCNRAPANQLRWKFETRGEYGWIRSALMINWCPCIVRFGIYATLTLVFGSNSNSTWRQFSSIVNTDDFFFCFISDRRRLQQIMLQDSSGHHMWATLLLLNPQAKQLVDSLGF